MNQPQSPACAELEVKLIELSHGELAGVDRQKVETHLNSCAVCQKFTAALVAMDQNLTQNIRLPALRQDFGLRLMDRVDLLAAPQLLDVVNFRHEQRLALEMEHRRSTAFRWSVWVRSALDLAAGVASLVGVVWVLRASPDTFTALTYDIPYGTLIFSQDALPYLIAGGAAIFGCLYSKTSGRVLNYFKF